MSDLYDADVLEWSEHQARLLRQHMAGEPVNEQPDWANIIEEVESVGRSQLSTVRSLLMRALEHDLKCMAWPQSRDVPHWKIEARRFASTRPKLSRPPCGSASTWTDFAARR